MDEYHTNRLPAISTKYSDHEGIFQHKEEQITELKTILKEKTKEEIHDRKRAPKLTLDVLTPAQELPLGLAVALAKDVIKIERYNREQKLLDEIRKNRLHYQSLKRQFSDESQKRFLGYSALHSTSYTSGANFSYFAPIDARKPARVETDPNFIPYTDRNNYFNNKTITMEKMRKFGQKHKTLKPVRKENSRHNLKTKAGLFYP